MLTDHQKDDEEPDEASERRTARRRSPSPRLDDDSEGAGYGREKKLDHEFCADEFLKLTEFRKF